MQKTTKSNFHLLMLPFKSMYFQIVKIAITKGVGGLNEMENILY